MTKVGQKERQRESGRMKAMGLIIVLMGALAAGLTCAHTGPDPCIGSYQDRLTMPCTCPATLDQACAPWPNDDAKRKHPDGGALDASSAVSFLSGDVTALTAMPDLIVVVRGVNLVGNDDEDNDCGAGMHSVTPMAPGVVCLRDGLTFSEALCKMRMSERDGVGTFSGSGDPWAEAVVDLMHRLPDAECGKPIDAMDSSEPNCPADSVLGCCGPDHRVGCFASGGRYIGPLIHHYFPRYESKNEGASR